MCDVGEQTKHPAHPSMRSITLNNPQQPSTICHNPHSLANQAMDRMRQNRRELAQLRNSSVVYGADLKRQSPAAHSRAEHIFN